jgi:hypothetical protein
VTLCRAFLHQPERPQRHRTAALYSTCAAKAEILHSLALPSPAASERPSAVPSALWHLIYQAAFARWRRLGLLAFHVQHA